jgi:hypothetical protein
MLRNDRYSVERFVRRQNHLEKPPEQTAPEGKGNLLLSPMHNLCH